MYKIKQNIVYPVHGIGKIIAIEKKKILGTTKNYYIIEFENTNMRIMVPVDKADEIGIRPVIKKSEVDKVLKILKSRKATIEEDWKSRYQNNTEKIKTGSIYEIAKVVKDLYRRNKTKELSIMERKMYESALNHIILEIATAKKISFEESEKIINKLLP